MITFILAPENVPQIDALKLAGVQHPLAPKIIGAMRQHGPIAMWKILNALAKNEYPETTAPSDGAGN